MPRPGGGVLYPKLGRHDRLGVGFQGKEDWPQKGCLESEMRTVAASGKVGGAREKAEFRAWRRERADHPRKNVGGNRMRSRCQKED